MIVTTIALALAVTLAPTSGTGALCSTDADCASKGYHDAYGVTPDKTRMYSDRYYVAEYTTLIPSEAGWSETEQADITYDPVAECLIAAGYRGLDDGEEVIYAGRDAIERCAR